MPADPKAENEADKAEQQARPVRGRRSKPMMGRARSSRAALRPEAKCHSLRALPLSTAQSTAGGARAVRRGVWDSGYSGWIMDMDMDVSDA